MNETSQETIMNFTVIDVESIYRRLLSTPDAKTRASIFQEQLIQPFEGLVQIFGGGDGLKAFRQWGMTPGQFGGASAATMQETVDLLAAHQAWERAAQSLCKGHEAFADHLDRIPTQHVTFGLLVADMSQMPISYGYSGFGAIPGWIMTIYDKPNAYNLERVEAATVHELHHNILAAVLGGRGLIANLGTYMISEGLAESFAAELYGADKVGPWVSTLTQTEVETAKRLLSTALHETEFTVMRQYIFGDKMSGQTRGVPDFAGYALGYHVVQTYLKRTGKSVVQATFIPPEEIIAESGFFTVLS
jgi:uncharacterized protein YjaZ